MNKNTIKLIKRERKANDDNYDLILNHIIRTIEYKKAVILDSTTNHNHNKYKRLKVVGVEECFIYLYFDNIFDHIYSRQKNLKEKKDSRLLFILNLTSSLKGKEQESFEDLIKEIRSLNIDIIIQTNSLTIIPLYIRVNVDLFYMIKLTSDYKENKKQLSKWFVNTCIVEDQNNLKEFLDKIPGDKKLYIKITIINPVSKTSTTEQLYVINEYKLKNKLIDSSLYYYNTKDSQYYFLNNQRKELDLEKEE